MVEPISRDEFLAHIEPIRGNIQELVQLQREQNGRVCKMDTRLGILEDRAPTRVAATIGAATGTFAGGIVTFLQYLFK